MPGWRVPIAISVAVHGALAATLLLMPPAPSHHDAREPVQIEIVTVEKPPAPPAAEELARNDVPPHQETIQPPIDRSKKKKKKKQEPVEVPPVAPPAGGGGVEGGGGPEVGTGGGTIVGGTGKTKDGRDLKSLDLSARVAVPKFEDQGPGIVLEEQRDPNRHATKDGGWNQKDSAFRAHVGGDGTVTFDSGGSSDVNGIPEFAVNGGSDTEAPSGGAKWSIDLNDWILSAAGDDPYSYEKRKFLEATREERLAMARAACGERLSSSLADLPQRLMKVWKSERPAEEKRTILFDLWDDCAEEGPTEVMRYGELARLTILDFIQKHLPEGSADAYTELELDKLNERRASSRKFTPYGGRM